MIKKIVVFMFTALLILTFNLSAFAEGNLNMGGSGSALGSATRPGDNFNWGQESVRVSIYNKEGNLAFPTHDWSNRNFAGTKIFWFGNKSKLDYMNDSTLNILQNNYDFGCNNDISIPRIVGPVGSNTIGSVKNFFKRKDIQKLFADEMGMTEEQFKSGEYTFLIEPVMLFKLDHITYAMTATEAALFSISQPQHGLRGFMGYLTHKALPLSMYLEEDSALLGLRKYTPPAPSGLFDDAYMIAYMGMGIIDPNEAPAPSDTIDYIYRVDTDVITAVNIEAKDDFAGSNKFDVTFSGLPIPANSPPSPTSSRTSQEYAAESGTDQIAWIKWHTPDEPGIYTIDITTSDSDAKPDKTTLTIVIKDLSENVPPNPLATDREPNFSTVDIDRVYADFEEVTSLEWTTQTRTRNPDYDADDPDNDEPKWEWNTHEYSLSVENSSGTIKPAASVPNTVDGANAMRSGYGIEAYVKSKLSGNIGINSTTSIQTVIVTFPEFGYQDYNRILDKNASGWSFKENPYSLLSEFNRVHFTPVWYPDEADYACAMVIRDAWTPAGELKVLVETDSITIEGSVFDDWHVRPTP